MDELIKIEINNNNEPVVNGRELHKALKIKTPYKQWFDGMLKYGFEENQDYIIFTEKNVKIEGRGRPGINHAITLNMAKELAMTQKNEMGQKVRKYFIECEKLLMRGKKPIQSFIDILSGKKPTKNHLENQKIWKLEGRTDRQIERRNHSVFMNLSRNEYLKELEIASPNLCSRISDIFNVAITGYNAQDLHKTRNIPQHRLVRDYFNEAELIAVIEAENLLGLYLETEHEKYSNVSYNRIIELANESANLAHKKAIQVSRTMKLPYHSSKFQTDLFEVITC